MDARRLYSRVFGGWLLAEQFRKRLRLRRHLLEDAGFNWIGRTDYEFRGGSFISRDIPYDERRVVAKAIENA